MGGLRSRALAWIFVFTGLVGGGVCSAQAQEEAVIKRATQLRSEPGAAGTVVVDVAAGARITRTSQRQGAWVQVRSESGAAGWIHMFDIGAPLRENAAADALRALGNKVGGGSSLTLPTATVGIRGLGEGNVSNSVGVGERGGSQSQGLGAAESLRVNADQARLFAASATLVPLRVDALPVPALAAPAAAAPGATPVGQAPSAAGGGAALGSLLQAVGGVTEAQELELGRQVAGLLLQGKPLDPTAEMQRYVNVLGRWISLQSSRPHLPWTFVVVDESDFNAYSAPGGYVFVTRGLVDRCTDEAELAGILAHEIAHVALQHPLYAMHNAARSGKVNTSLNALARHVHLMGHGADAEHAADREAVALAARAGLDPFGLVLALVQLNALGDSDLQYADAHPQSRLRLDHLEQAMAQRLDGLAGPKTAITIEQRLAAVERK